ncbi:ligand-binding sensor domain-containing protein [Pedobacter jejuensis]|uniref:histidine kinase n=1 Tax=Pedobacter jejuensis TaxID=1268550 RepID=A0A3N0C3L9_9SPHI|nr:sensor histidine kinase [Pedobacter jejuensis]RNL56547.1 histidine kinase [Pedobacter jejuensis]
MILRLLILTILFFTVRFSAAQPYYFRHYQVENGLSHNTVFCSAQDGSGFMWFGTKDGLNRFDGYQFKTYRFDAEKAGSLGNDLIYALHNDAKNRLWVGTNSGVYLYLPQHESFEIVKGTENLRINDMATDTRGNLWIVALGRTLIYNINKKALSQFNDKAKFVATSVSAMKDGSIWISTLQGTIEEYDFTNKKFRSHYVMSKLNPNENSWATKVRDAGNNTILIGTANQGIKLFDRKTFKTKELLVFNADKTSIYVRDIYQAAKNEFWIATESGIYIYANQRITRLRKQYGNAYSLSDEAIYSVYQDREKGIWVGTYFGGINYYSSQYALFTKYFPQKEVNALSGSDVREICKDAYGNLWIGTEDAGLNMLNTKTGQFTNFFPDGKSSSISYSNIHGLLVDDDKLWIGTFEHGLDVLDIKTKKVVKHYTAGNKSGLKTGFVVTFCKTKGGEILLATITGLYRYNRQKDNFEPIEGLPTVFYEVLTEDSKGNIWAGTFDSGIIRFKPGKPGFIQYKNNPKNNNSLSHNTVNGIYEDSKQNIWVSTDGGGLNLFDAKNETFKHITVKDGLPSNFLFKIMEDEEGKLWMGSTRGLIHFNPVNRSIKVYSKSNGLLTDQFNYNSGFKADDGRLYFGSVRGLISFLPGELKNFNFKSPVQITGFQIDGADEKQDNLVIPQSILYTKKIILNDAQSSFSVDFAAINYTAPDMTQYAYRMKGLSDKWNYLKTNRKVYFTKLSAGNYVFEVKALLNGSDNWTENNPQISIKILPPIYQSTLAYVIYGIVIALTVLYLIKTYHKKMENRSQRRMERFENQKEKEIYQAKIEFFTNIAHEIRTPLTLIKAPMEKIIKQASGVPFIEKNLRTMERNTDRLFNLTNQLLDFRKTEVNGFSLNFVNANISDILLEIFEVFQPVADAKGFSYKLYLPDKKLFAYVDTEAFYKIMSNLIDNALKYSEQLIEIKLNFEASNAEFFTVSVTNDGLPIQAELREKIFEPFFRATENQFKQGTGIGLSLSKALTELHGGNLFASLDEREQNIFILQLPIHQLFEFDLKGKWKKQ